MTIEKCSVKANQFVENIKTMMIDIVIADIVNSIRFHIKNLTKNPSGKINKKCDYLLNLSMANTTFL